MLQSYCIFQSSKLYNIKDYIKYSPLLEKVSPRSREGLLILCYHGVRGVCLILCWKYRDLRPAQKAGGQGKSLVGPIKKKTKTMWGEAQWGNTTKNSEETPQKSEETVSSRSLEPCLNLFLFPFAGSFAAFPRGCGPPRHLGSEVWIYKGNVLWRHTEFIKVMYYDVTQWRVTYNPRSIS